MSAKQFFSEESQWHKYVRREMIYCDEQPLQQEALELEEKRQALREAAA